MITRKPSNITKSLVNDTHEDHLNITKAIIDNAPVTEMSSVVRSINFDTDGDGSYILRKPLVKKQNLNYEYNKEILLYDRETIMSREVNISTLVPYTEFSGGIDHIKLRFYDNKLIFHEVKYTDTLPNPWLLGVKNYINTTDHTLISAEIDHTQFLKSLSGKDLGLLHVINYNNVLWNFVEVRAGYTNIIRGTARAEIQAESLPNPNDIVCDYLGFSLTDGTVTQHVQVKPTSIRVTEGTPNIILGFSYSFEINSSDFAALGSLLLTLESLGNIAVRPDWLLVNDTYDDVFGFDTPNSIGNTLKRFIKIYKDDSQDDTFIYEIISPEVNSFTSATDTNSMLDANLLLDNPYAVRDLYNYGYVSCTRVLPYTLVEDDEDISLSDFNIRKIWELTEKGTFNNNSQGFKLLVSSNANVFDKKFLLLKAFLTTNITSAKYYCCWEYSTDDGITWKQFTDDQYYNRFASNLVSSLTVVDMTSAEFDKALETESLTEEASYLVTKKLVRMDLSSKDYSFEDSILTRPDVLILQTPNLTYKYRFLIYIDTDKAIPTPSDKTFTEVKTSFESASSGYVDTAHKFSYTVGKHVSSHDSLSIPYVDTDGGLVLCEYVKASDTPDDYPLMTHYGNYITISCEDSDYTIKTIAIRLANKKYTGTHQELVEDLDASTVGYQKTITASDLVAGNYYYITYHDTQPAPPTVWSTIHDHYDHEAKTGKQKTSDGANVYMFKYVRNGSNINVTYLKFTKVNGWGNYGTYEEKGTYSAPSFKVKVASPYQSFDITISNTDITRYVDIVRSSGGATGGTITCDTPVYGEIKEKWVEVSDYDFRGAVVGFSTEDPLTDLTMEGCQYYGIQCDYAPPATPTETQSQDKILYNASSLWLNEGTLKEFTVPENNTSNKITILNLTSCAEGNHALPGTPDLEALSGSSDVTQSRLKIVELVVTYVVKGQVLYSSTYLQSMTGTYAIQYSDNTVYVEDLTADRNRIFLGQYYYNENQAQLLAYKDSYIYSSGTNSAIMKFLNSLNLPEEIVKIISWRGYLLLFTKTSIYLAKYDSSIDGYNVKVLSNTVGVPKVDADTIVPILNSIYFKSGNKIYRLVPNLYASSDDILNIKQISMGVNNILENLTNTYEEEHNFGHADADKYLVFIPVAQGTGHVTYCICFDFVKQLWTLHKYPLELVGIEKISNTELYLKGDVTLYYFTENLSRLVYLGLKQYCQTKHYALSDYDPQAYIGTVPYGDYLDYTPEMIINKIETDAVNQDNAEKMFQQLVTPIDFEIDFGQKSSNYTLDKQFLETKFVLATLNSKDNFPLSVDIYTDGVERELHWDVNTDAPLWKTSLNDVGILNTSFVPAGADYNGILKQLIIKYSGKGKSIRHIISGKSKSLFKFYSMDVRARILPKKR